ncbi:MAG: polyprenyl synthetase family protein [Candidatus Gracilibacteria bacterium]|nr:polyprenyl synthetase family protein [Candidatus Gracilibacteria bacterium]
MLPNWYNTYKETIEKNIDLFFEEYLSKKTSKPLEEFKEVIKYSVLGGKKVRAILALEFYLNLSNKKIEDIKGDDDIIKFCIALELIHAYSLIHDDLPAMDNDSLRRGQLTVWKKFSECDAILAGDLLNTISFEILSDLSSPADSVMLIKLLSNAVGFYGMIGGQVEDLYFEKNSGELNIDLLKKLHAKKTGALIRTSIIGGIVLSGNTQNFENYSRFADNIGLAFQIKDDLLDVEGTSEETGKSVGGENKGFVHFLGLEKSKQELDRLISDSLELILPLKSEKLNFITNYIQKRNK